MFSSNAQTITKIQMITGLSSIAGLFYFDFTLSNLILLLASFYIYSVVGIGLTLHRYYAHKSFEFRFVFMKWICTLIAILSGRASILGWVYVHRLHHAYSDTEKDPHGPGNIGFKLFNFKHIESTAGKMNVFLVKDLMNKQQIFIHDYYLAIILAFVFVLAIFGLDVAYFVWVLPVFLVQMSQNSFNYFAHTYGYRNYETKDTSSNNALLWPLIMGDAWHNNHHGNPASMTTQFKWWEIDPAGYLIRMIRK